MRYQVKHGGARTKTHSFLFSTALVGLGAFGIVTALLLRFFVPGQVTLFPLNEYEVMTLQGTGVSYFSAVHLTELSGVTMRATYTIKGDAAGAQATGNPNTAIWQSFTAVEDITNRAPFEYQYEHLAFDRKTGALINCCGNVIGNDSRVRVGGQGYVWPFRTEKHNYQVFDATALKPVTARYAGTATTAGIATYRFVELVPKQQVGTQTLPGSLVGAATASVTLPEFYAATNTYSVDPVTGDPLRISENQRLTLQDNSGATRLVVFQGTLTTTPASVRTVASPDRSNLSEIHLIEVVIPVTIGILGLVLLAVGLALSRRSRSPDAESLPSDTTSPLLG